MKFMVTYSYSADKFPPIVKAWSSMSPQERADVGDGVKLIGRWHDVVCGRAVGIFESNDLTAVSRFCGRWNSLGACVITPVLGDEEAAVAARQIAADHNAWCRLMPTAAMRGGQSFASTMPEHSAALCC